MFTLPTDGRPILDALKRGHGDKRQRERRADVMHGIAGLVIRVTVVLSMAAALVLVGAPQPTDSDYEVTPGHDCPFPAHLHVRGRQSVLLLPEDARIITSTLSATVPNLSSGASVTLYDFAMTPVHGWLPLRRHPR